MDNNDVFNEERDFERLNELKYKINDEEYLRRAIYKIASDISEVLHFD